MSKQVAVIGGGPGGYVAAIRLAQLGAAVTLIEQDKFGGTCLNRGCIPTKVLLHAAESLRALQSDARFGLKVSDASLDWNTLQQHKSAVVSELVGGIGGLLRSNGIKTIKSAARFVDVNTLLLTEPSGGQSTLSAESFVVATGAQAALPPIPGIDLPDILTSDGVLALESLPESMVTIGGGVIGIEFACALSAMGVKVTVLEALPEILPAFDAQLAGMLRQKLTAQGINFRTSVVVSKIAVTQEGYAVSVTDQHGAEHTLSGEKVMVCTGRRACTDMLNLKAAGVETDRGRIIVNDRMQTCRSHIYAIGDCASSLQLAHVASREGEVAAENICGNPRKMSYRAVPSCIYTTPEFASVGLTEKSACDAGYDVRVGCFPLTRNAKARIVGEDGFFKVVTNAKYGEILGVHLLGARATELISDATMAITAELTTDQVFETIYAHPTVSEAVAEAFMDTSERAIHIPSRNKGVG